MIRIRQLTPADLSQAREVWESSFNDQPAFLDWYFRDRFHPEEGLGVFAEDQGKDAPLLSGLHLAPYYFRRRGQILPTAYLIALATRSEYRRKGLATRLLKHALNHLAATGRCFTFLLPFNLEFYYRLGWGPLSALRSYRLLPQQALTGPASSGSVARTDSPRLTDLKRIFSSWSSQFDNYLQRQDADWQGLLYDHLLDGGEVWLAQNDEGTPEGYALTLQGKDGNLLRELAYTSLHVGQRLLTRVLRETKSSLTWTVPDNERLALGARDLKPSPLYLGRITDLKGMLESLSYSNRIDLVFQIHDPLIEANNGLFRLLVGEDGRARVSSAPCLQPEFSCGIELLTPLIFGFPDPSAAGLADRLSKDPFPERFPPAFTALFPESTCYINDYF